MAITQLIQVKVYEQLKDMILSGRLKNGTIYRGAQLAHDLGVSRTPVRDALNRLGQDGFVDIIPSIGFCLHEPNEKDLRNILQFRSAMETYCARLLSEDFAAGMPDALSAASALKDSIEQLEKLDLEKDLETFAQIDLSFHRELITYADNDIFNMYYDINLFLIKQCLHRALTMPQRMEKTISEHKSIYEAICCESQNIYDSVVSHINVALIVPPSKTDIY